MKMHKKATLILISFLALLAVTACGKTDGGETVPQNETPSADTETIAEEATEEEAPIDYTADLSTERYDGYNFRILTRKGQTGSQYFADPQEDIVDSAVYRRNKAVEDRYGITITAAESASHDYDISAMETILAGDDAYDIIFAHSRAAFVYALNGACVNVHDIDAIHLDKTWWSKDITQSCDVGGKLYILDGDISADSVEKAMCMYFNKRIFDELGLDYPYETVKDGDWTFDQFAYLVKKGGKDLDGDGVMNTDADQFGFGGYGGWHAPVNILYTGGQKIYDKTDDGQFTVSLYSNKTVEIYERFFNLMSNEACELKLGIPQFMQGRLMISAGMLGDAKEMRSMEDEFGIIPYPKYSDEDEYATVTNGGSVLMVIPVTVPDPEKTGAITEALCAYGSEMVIPTLYDKALKTKYARDDESEEMIDLVRDSIVFDVGYLSGGPLQNVGYDLAQMEIPNFSSYYAARKGPAEAELSAFLENYGNKQN